MVGYCGINCLECKAYKATVAGDEQGLQDMAAKFGHGEDQPLDWVCLGCGPHNQHLLAKYCLSCKIRLCATAKRVSSCAECDGFEQCTALQDFIKTESETLGRTMGWLRARFLAVHGRNAAMSGQPAR